MKNPIKLIGDMPWTELRQLIIDELEKCRTQLELERIISLLVASTGTIQEITKRRRNLGIPIDKSLGEQLKNSKKMKR